MTQLAVTYAAKSTQDRNLSIPEQQEDCREMCAEKGWEIIGEFADEGFTAYTGNRGPGLAAAIELAKRTAAERGCEVFIVAQHTSRFARGDGARPDAPKALVELYHEWARANVRGRLVENDLAMSTSVAAAVQGEADHNDSKRKGKSVAKGMRRRARDRQRLAGGPRPYGYRWGEPYKERDADRHERTVRDLVVVPDESAVVKRIYADAIAGKSQQSIAAVLNREDIPSATGKRWIQASVRRVLTNPIYVGRIRHNGEEYVGSHAAILDDDTFLAAKAIREAQASIRNKGGGRRAKGHHLLTKGLLRCSCGAAMTPRVFVNRRSPPTETYFCSSRDADVDSCTQRPIRRELIDGPLLEELTDRYLDLDETRERLRARRSSDAAIAASTLGEGESELLRARDRLARVVRDYQNGKLDVDDYSAQRAGLLEEQQAAEAAAERARRRVEDLRGGMDDAEEETLRRLASLRAAVLGQLDEAPDLDALRTLLRQLFESIVYVTGDEPCADLPIPEPESADWDAADPVRVAGAHLFLVLRPGVVTGYSANPRTDHSLAGGFPEPLIARAPLGFAASKRVGLPPGLVPAGDLEALFAPVRVA